MSNLFNDERIFNNRYRTFLIVILIIGIISMTIVYANFTRRLQIVSTAKVNASNWDIHFENLVKVKNDTSSAATVISEPSISKERTIISGLDVELRKPGDYVTYTFDIVNAGDIDAKLYNYTHSTPTCEKYQSVCNNIKYIIKYTDGNEIKVSDSLKKGQRRNATLTIKLDESVTSMPSEKVTASDLTAIFDYVQE